MGYSNALGNLQQVYGSSDIGAASKTGASGKAEQGAESSSVTLASSVTVSDQAKLSTVGGLVAQALDGSDVRTDKVAALQSSIAAGTYSVPASDVAGKLIDVLLK